MKRIWVLVFSFMYLVSVDPMDRSIIGSKKSKFVSQPEWAALTIYLYDLLQTRMKYQIHLENLSNLHIFLGNLSFRIVGWIINSIFYRVWRWRIGFFICHQLIWRNFFVWQGHFRSLLIWRVGPFRSFRQTVANYLICQFLETNKGRLEKKWGKQCKYCCDYIVPKEFIYLFCAKKETIN